MMKGMTSMIPLQSKLEHMEKPYPDVVGELEQHGYVLGGNWDYDHGYFDRPLDDSREVWLRVPFQVTNGQLNGEAAEANIDTMITFGKPFVLKHIVERGIDEEGSSGVLRSLVDQFQDPIDPDASVEQHWVEQANQHIHTIERAIIQ